MWRFYLVLVALVASLGCPLLSHAQVPFFGGASAFSPEISVVNSGVLNDVQATVSPDRKYVTLTMRPQSSQLLALREFAFTVPQPVGFVGGMNFDIGGGIVDTGEFGAINPPVALGPPGRGAALFHQRGMTRIVSR
jgi:hypothetical protein